MVNPISMLVDYAQAGWTWLLSLFQTGVVLDNNGNAVSIVNTDKYQWSDNMGAFLEVLAYCEGTAGRGDNDGYDVLFGYTDSNHVVFTDYSKHPHIKRPYGNTFSTAAGRYQINWGTWLGLCPKLGVSDFTPETQDRMAVLLLQQCGADKYIDAGDIFNACRKASGTWASLPFSTAGQPTRNMDYVTNYFTQNGGSVA